MDFKESLIQQMTVRIFIVRSLLALIIIMTALLISGLRHKVYDYEPYLFFTIFLLAFWVVGIFLGMFISIIIQNHKKELMIYAWSQALVFSCLLSYLAYNKIDSWLEEKNNGNIEFNQSLVEFNENQSEYSIADPNVKNAFRLLEATFSDPNSFRLTKWFMSDSLIYFRYIYNEKQYYSCVEILKDSNMKIKILKGDPHLDQNFVNAEKIIDKQFKIEMDKQ